MPFFLSAIGNEQQFNANGSPLSGGKINTYAAGTTTRVATHTDKAGATEHANPIILNTLGLPANPIWLKGGVSYKFVITDSADVVQRTVDDITGINDPAVASSVDQWVLFTAVPTFISATSFSLAGDQTNTFQVGRRVKSANTGGTGYHTITASTFAASITTVTVTNDSLVLDAGISAVSYGLLSAVNRSATAAAISNTPAGGVTELEVQGAINGLEARKASINGMKPLAVASGTGSLPASSFGRLTYLLSSSGTQTLPAASSAPSGGAITLYALDVSFTIASAGTDIIYVHGLSGIASFTLNIGEAVTLVTNGADAWFAASNAQRSFGRGQTLTDVTASRAQSVTYTNSTARPIFVQATLSASVAGNSVLSVGGVSCDIAYLRVSELQTLSGMVMPGQTYQVASSGATFTIFTWVETR